MAHDWCDCHWCRRYFGFADINQMVGGKSVRVARQGAIRSWKASLGGKRSWWSPQTRATGHSEDQHRLLIVFIIERAARAKATKALRGPPRRAFTVFWCQT